MEPYVPNHEIKRATKVILEVIKNILIAFSSIFTKKVVLQKVLFDPIMVDIAPNPNVVLKDTFVEKELMFGLVKSLLEVKRPTAQ
jgi:hypothetical protein